MAEQADDLQVLVVRVGGRSYALAIGVVREVLPLSEPIAVPGWREPALGLIELRGEFVPMLDIAPTLGAPPTALASTKFVIVTWAADKVWGLLVDSVESVQTVATKLQRPASPVAATSTQPDDLWSGLVETSAGPVVLLSADRLIGALKESALISEPMVRAGARP